MRKLLLLKAVFLCMVMVVLGLSLTACGDDESEEVVVEHETIKVSYAVSLSEDWYKYFDIEVSYTGEGAVESKTLDMDWKMNISIPASAEPDKYVFSVAAKPKAVTPELDPTVETYELSSSYSFNVSAINTDGTVDDSYIISQSVEDETSVFDKAGMEAMIKEGIVLFSFEQTPRTY